MVAPNDPYWFLASLHDAEGVSEVLDIGSAAVPRGGNSRLLVDDIFTGPGVVNLDPFLAGMPNPALIVLDVPGGATVSFNGGVSFTAFKLKQFHLSFSGAGTIAKIRLTLTADSRVRLWAYEEDP
ncbi:MAG: hypothetical protein WC895_05125 [Candidatus Shapirobacteria bacterium]|jgi:hypothetical protein